MIVSGSIREFYNRVFNFKRYAEYSMEDINKMYPYELEIYSALTIQAMEKEKGQREK